MVYTNMYVRYVRYDAVNRYLKKSLDRGVHEKVQSGTVSSLTFFSRDSDPPRSLNIAHSLIFCIVRCKKKVESERTEGW